MKMKGVIVLGFILLITTGTAVSRASDDEYTRESLKGLKGVRVVIENIDPEVERAGLTKASIRTDVELKLRLAGIPVLSEKTYGPFLYVQTAVFPSRSGYWPFCIIVALHQDVILARDRSIFVPANSWDVTYVGLVGKGSARKVRDEIKDMVDDFINAYLSVNPK